MDEPIFKRVIQFPCPICKTPCKVADSSYWINHKQLPQLCVLNRIMMYMDEPGANHYYLFSHMRSLDRSDEQLIWDEFINIYETKLKYILVLEKF